ncbi:MAG TPA: hypothetical protein VF982_03370 [Anaerolineales bacterium]
MNDLSSLSIVLKVTRILEELDIEYLVVGSLASALHGVSRSTLDGDLVADIQASHIQGLVDRLGSEFSTDQQMMAEAVIQKSSFNLIHRASMFKIDLFIPKDSFNRSELKRRQRYPLTNNKGDSAFVGTAEDTILAKLRWYRLGNEVSDRQWKDVTEILKIQGGRLDLKYMREWSEKIGVMDLLTKALSETGMQ